MINAARLAFAHHLSTSDLGSRYHEFHNALRDHEAAEKKILQEAYNVDIGTKD
jgi:hypothetical protein